MEHGISPNEILQGQTDVILSRPTQYHHNDNILRLRKPYDKETALPQTKINILTLVAGEQQTHNYYAEHGMEYGNDCLRETYAEIKDVEEEHVTMYESLIDPTESLYEKLLLHEFMEVCTYYNCLEDEKNEMIRPIWEEFLDYELGHLAIASQLFKKHEGRDPEEVVGSEIVYPCRFMSQKEYVSNILVNEIDKRLGMDKDYTTVKKLPEDWPSYEVQDTVNDEGSPTERTIQLITTLKDRDLVTASESLKKEIPKLLQKALEPKSQAPDTVTVEEYKEMNEYQFEF